LWLSQESYIEKVLEVFNMNKDKSVTMHWGINSRSTLIKPPLANEKENMKKIQYSYSYSTWTMTQLLMYAIVCASSDITYAWHFFFLCVSRFHTNTGKELYKRAKRMLNISKANKNFVCVLKVVSQCENVKLMQKWETLPPQSQHSSTFYFNFWGE